MGALGKYTTGSEDCRMADASGVNVLVRSTTRTILFLVVYQSSDYATEVKTRSITQYDTA